MIKREMEVTKVKVVKGKSQSSDVRETKEDVFLDRRASQQY